jgi:hypothetical protein
MNDSVHCGSNDFRDYLREKTLNKAYLKLLIPYLIVNEDSEHGCHSMSGNYFNEIRENMMILDNYK